MDTRRIADLEVSVVGLGCNNFGWRIDERASRAVVDAAIEEGINFFDTADIYGGTKSERFLGRALKGQRDDVILATKFGGEVDKKRKGARPEYVLQACEDSLQRLGTEYIDLYQLHKPDPAVPIVETLDALNELVRTAKVRQIGCSNFSAAQILEAEETSKRMHLARFVSVQNNYNMLEREAEKDAIPVCEQLGLAFLPYFPLASGLLSGKFRIDNPPPAGSRLAEVDSLKQKVTDHKLRIVEQLIAYAKSKHHTLLELAMSWLLRLPVVASVIAGATKPAQVRANAAAPNWKLSESDIEAIDRILAGS